MAKRRNLLVVTFAGMGLIATLLGCEEQPQARVYETPKEQHLELKPPPVATGAEFTPPDAWQAGKSGAMRKAAYEVTENGKKAEITVIDLPPAGGDRLANVNRWRGQISLGSITAEELEAQIEPIEVDGVTGDYVEMAMPEDSNPREMILGAIVNTPDRVRFFKLRGDYSLAEQERERFKEFVRSAKIPSAESDSDG